MKKYFVYFSYRRRNSEDQTVSPSLFTFEIVTLDDAPLHAVRHETDISKSGVLIALQNLGMGYHNINVLHMNPL